MQGEMTEARAYQEGGSPAEGGEGGGGPNRPSAKPGSSSEIPPTRRRRSTAAASRGLRRVAGWIAPNLKGSSATGPAREEGAKMDNPEGAHVSVRWVMNGAHRADTSAQPMAGIVA
jgi:hypothetical protein